MFSFAILIFINMVSAQLQRQSTVDAATPNANSVTIYHDPQSAIISGSFYNITVQSQNAYDLLVSLDSKWGFKSTVESTLSVIINGATPNPVSDTDFLIIFVVGNTQFFSFFTHLDVNIIAAKIYPLDTIGTKSSVSAWMADDSLYTERWERVSDGGGDNWQNTNPRHKAQSFWPLKFEVINDPINDLCQFKFYNHSTDYVAGNLFNGSFDPLQNIDIYIMGDTTGEKFNVHSIAIEQYHVDGVPTTEPTSSPVPDPTHNPSDNPTHIPSTSPVTASPSNPPSTNNPSVTPTDIPSIPPTNVPSTTPTRTPSQNPSVSPTVTGVPSSTPTMEPTLIPSINPTVSPSSDPISSSVFTQSPTDNPSSVPTEAPITSTAPSTHPTFIPSVTPSAKPSVAPTTSTYAPSDTPTIGNHVIHPTTEIPSFLPTSEPTLYIFDTEEVPQAETSAAEEDKLENTPRPRWTLETTSYIVIIVIFISICFIMVLIMLVCAKKNRNKNHLNQRKAAEALAMNQRRDNNHHDPAPRGKKLKPYHQVDSRAKVAMIPRPIKTEDSQSTGKSSSKVSSSDDVNMDEVANEIRDLKLTREHGTFGSSESHREESEDDDETSAASGPVVRFLDAVQDGVNYEETETKREEMTDTEMTEDDGFKDRTMPMPFKKNTSGGSYDVDGGINPAAFLPGDDIRHGTSHAHANDAGFIIHAPPATNTTHMSTITHSATQMSHEAVADDDDNSSDDSYHDRMAAYNFVENQQILNAHDMAIKNVNKEVNVGPMMMMLDIMKTTQSPKSTTSKEHLSLMVEHGDSLDAKPIKNFTDTI